MNFFIPVAKDKLMSKTSQKKESRIFYRQTPFEVVVLQDGIELASYRSVNELVETHMKGITAKSQLDEKIAYKNQIPYLPFPAIDTSD